MTMNHIKLQKIVNISRRHMSEWCLSPKQIDKVEVTGFCVCDIYHLLPHQVPIS